jgi:hypothetical protein
MASTLSHDPQPRNFNLLENGGHARRTGRGRRSPWSRLALGTALIAVSATGCVGDNRSVTEPDLVLPVFSHGGDEGGPHGTHMSGANETPPRPSRAQGQLVLRLEDDGTLAFKLLAANIEDVTQAHIHLAPPGVPGPVIAWLYPAAPPAVHIPGRFDGVLAAGIITDADVTGPLAGQGVASLVAAIRAGNAYANIHTILYPPGEIRGQVR